MPAPVERRILDVNAIATGRAEPSTAAEWFVRIYAPVPGEEGVPKEWQERFRDALQEAFSYGRETGRYEANPTEGLAPDVAAARTAYADAAMTYHRHPTADNKRIADEAFKKFRQVRHDDIESRRD